MASAPRVASGLLAAVVVAALTINYGGFSQVGQNARLPGQVRRLTETSEDEGEKEAGTSDEPKLVRVVAPYAGEGKEGVISVHRNDYVFHYGKWDKRNGWTYVTQLVPGKDGQESSYGRSGYVPDWSLEQDAVEQADASSDGQEGERQEDAKRGTQEGERKEEDAKRGAKDEDIKDEDLEEGTKEEASGSSEETEGTKEEAIGSSEERDPEEEEAADEVPPWARKG